MSHNHKTLISKIAVAALFSVVGATALPGITSHASAATVVSSASAKTAPGQPKFGESGPAVVAVQSAIMRHGFTLRGGATGNFDARTRSVLCAQSMSCMQGCASYEMPWASYRMARPLAPQVGFLTLNSGA